jgi:hypothetical protein
MGVLWPRFGDIAAGWIVEGITASLAVLTKY